MALSLSLDANSSSSETSRLNPSEEVTVKSEKPDCDMTFTLNPSVSSGLLYHF